MTSWTEGHEAPLDSAVLARFHRLALEVLRRRDGAFFARELAFGFQFVVIGAVPIVGTARFGWDALSWLAYVVIGAWLGIVTDALAPAFLGRRGAGLFLLMIIVIAAADKNAGPQRQLPVALYVTNGSVVLFGHLNTFGMVPVRRENRWLARYLGECRTGPTDGPNAP